tara:strand:- start:1417 stop:1794 length:378 start_codon:yes stop_codon:yes gene_type:complete
MFEKNYFKKDYFKKDYFNDSRRLNDAIRILLLELLHNKNKIFHLTLLNDKIIENIVKITITNYFNNFIPQKYSYLPIYDVIKEITIKKLRKKNKYIKKHLFIRIILLDRFPKDFIYKYKNIFLDF